LSIVMIIDDHFRLAGIYIIVTLGTGQSFQINF